LSQINTRGIGPLGSGRSQRTVANTSLYVFG
jgi:hypothetical protein